MSNAHNTRIRVDGIDDEGYVHGAIETKDTDVPFADWDWRSREIFGPSAEDLRSVDFTRGPVYFTIHEWMDWEVAQWPEDDVPHTLHVWSRTV